MVAWAKMLQTYSEDRGLVVAIKDTFDGGHPCAMCKKISAEKEGESQKKQPASNMEQGAVAKWLGVASAAVLPGPAWCHGSAVSQHPACSPHYYRWDILPPVPPPKIAA